jgi:hypothetical protein
LLITPVKNVVKGTKLLIDLNTGEATIKTEPTASSSTSMISAGDISSDGKTFKADRPSAVFYPGQFQKKAKKAAEGVASEIDGWQVRSSP